MGRLLEQFDPNINELGLTTNKNGTLGGNYTFGGNVTINGTLTTSGAISETVPFTLTGANAAAISVGPNGATNPTFQVDTSETNAATGILVEGFAAGTGVAIETQSSGNNENLTIDAKGSGTVTLGSVSTGNVVTQSLLSSPKGITSTIPVAGNVVGLTVVQNDTTNNPNSINVTNTGTGKAVNISQSGVGAGFILNDSGGTRNEFNRSVNGVNGFNPVLYVNASSSGETVGALGVNINSTSASGYGINVTQTGTGTGLILAGNPVSNTGVVSQVNNPTQTITGTVTDGFLGGIRISPTYTAATAQTVTRHNYLDLKNPTLSGAGPAALTNATIIRFDAAAGTHAAVDGATTKTTPTAVDAWVKINLNGTIAYIPAYLSKTA